MPFTDCIVKIFSTCLHVTTSQRSTCVHLKKEKKSITCLQKELCGCVNKMKVDGNSR